MKTYDEVISEITSMRYEDGLLKGERFTSLTKEAMANQKTSILIASILARGCELLPTVLIAYLAGIVVGVEMEKSLDGVELGE